MSLLGSYTSLLGVYISLFWNMHISLLGIIARTWGPTTWCSWIDWSWQGVCMCLIWVYTSQTGERQCVAVCCGVSQKWSIVVCQVTYAYDVYTHTRVRQSSVTCNTQNSVSLGYIQVRHMKGNSLLSHVPEVQQRNAHYLIVRDTVCVCVSLGYIQVRHMKGNSFLSHVPEVQQFDVAHLIVRDRVCICLFRAYTCVFWV